MGSSANTHALVAARLGYNGEHHEPTSAWQSLGNGHRIYNPVLMRFHSADHESPFARGGINAYAYCGDEPVNRTDPTGRRFHWKLMAMIPMGTGLGLAIASTRSLLSDDEPHEMILSVVGILAGLAIMGGSSYYVGLKGRPKAPPPTPVEPSAPPLSPPPQTSSPVAQRQTPMLTSQPAASLPTRPVAQPPSSESARLPETLPSPASETLHLPVPMVTPSASVTPPVIQKVRVIRQYTVSLNVRRNSIAPPKRVGKGKGKFERRRSEYAYTTSLAGA